ncbi:C-C motif chemokine 4 homolog [Vombatus ursinus]|uniref:C-C motif chemokine 4 homolog n=1 Tax=Vombatus ursinus TaxID=29139 RepID=UPI000FFD9893|nr:C-C motif chemokine 4 homolog [Vombatus ursinus]XP_027718321.1 C-C motif chemokine 4 homolog [Vombatus ursinus]
MQHISMVLLCLLLVTSGPQGSFSSSLVDSKPTCCFNFLKRNLPHYLIKSYSITSRSCSYNAVMFTLKKGKIYCAHLEDKWVQDYLNKMNKMNSRGSIQSQI